MMSRFPSLLLLACLGHTPVPVLANRCFADRDALRYAIDVCFAGGVGKDECHTATDTNATACDLVKAARGWPVNEWCVGEVTDMRYLFVEKEDFDEDLSAWDTSQVTDFGYMFSYASAFDGDVSTWDTSKARSMLGMFHAAASFNGDLSAWDTSSVTDIKWMFYDAAAFNGDLSRWDVGQVTDMREAFAFASAFNGDLGAWTTSRVTDMSGLFYKAKAFNADLAGWDLSAVNVTELGIFQGAAAFNRDLCAWRDAFPYAIAKNTFKKTNCTHPGTPQLEDGGPFCASNCSGAPPVAVADTSAVVVPDATETAPDSTEDAASEQAQSPAPTVMVPDATNESAQSPAPVRSHSVIVAAVGAVAGWTLCLLLV